MHLGKTPERHSLPAMKNTVQGHHHCSVLLHPRLPSQKYKRRSTPLRTPILCTPPFFPALCRMYTQPSYHSPTLEVVRSGVGSRKATRTPACALAIRGQHVKHMNAWHASGNARERHAETAHTIGASCDRAKSVFPPPNAWEPKNISVERTAATEWIQ